RRQRTEIRARRRAAFRQRRPRSVMLSCCPPIILAAAERAASPKDRALASWRLWRSCPRGPAPLSFACCLRAPPLGPRAYEDGKREQITPQQCPALGSPVL